MWVGRAEGAADISEYSEPGAQKVYETWIDAYGNTVRVHYDHNPPGNVSGDVTHLHLR